VDAVLALHELERLVGGDGGADLHARAGERGRARPVSLPDVDPIDVGAAEQPGEHEVGVPSRRVALADAPTVRVGLEDAQAGAQARRQHVVVAL
jgi:hypothetical protein